MKIYIETARPPRWPRGTWGPIGRKFNAIWANRREIAGRWKRRIDAIFSF